MMINKYYEKTKLYIKENLGFLITLVAIFMFFQINTGYSIYKPGGSINITERITRANNGLYAVSGSINMAYVGMIEGKLPFYLLAKIIPSWDTVKNTEITYDDSESIKDMLKRDHIYYEESISNAQYLAYDRSGIDFSVSKETNYIVYVNKDCKADIRIGDEILKYDGNSYTDLATLKAYIKTKSVGEEVVFTLKRDGKEIKSKAKIYLEAEQKLICLAGSTIYEFDSPIKINLDAKASESGPSGGLMLALALYNALSNEDITKGRKIVGTGTIDLDGVVGAIGGVKYKLAGAVQDKADIFIVPAENYDEAVAYAKTQKYDILIKGVATFDEALGVLANLDKANY